VAKLVKEKRRLSKIYCKSKKVKKKVKIKVDQKKYEEAK
jgi:hypothetical protein